MALCNDVLNNDPDDIVGRFALFLLGYILIESDKNGLASHIFSRLNDLQPNQGSIYTNWAMSIQETNPEKAIKLFKRAIELEPENDKGYANLGLTCLWTAKPQKCVEYSNKALKLNPDVRAAHHNRGLAKIMLGQWEEGWKDYYDCLGVKHREARDYGIPDWDGTSEGRVLVYGEQGVGDEIMFASILDEIPNPIVLDCDKRLESLFRRSFDFPVYGTRYGPPKSYDCDFQLAIGQLPHFYRKKKTDCPGTPYLKPDPERCLQWRALFDTYPGKKIGVAWRGGIPGTKEKERSLDLSDLEPLFNEDDTFISLEYKSVHETDAALYNLKVFEETEKGRNIDALAALVNELDVVITACTTIVYIAGALGKECHVLVPAEPGYRYHLKGDFPWYESVSLHRQKKGEAWKTTVERLLKSLSGTTLRRQLPTTSSVIQSSVGQPSPSRLRQSINATSQNLPGG